MNGADVDSGMHRPAWPAVIRHHDDPELIYVASAAALQQPDLLGALGYDEAETLIDVRGVEYTLHMQDKKISPRSSGVVRTLYDILGLVKAHAAQTGACCIAKLYAPTIADAYEIVRASFQE